jgi:hypothetical protein
VIVGYFHGEDAHHVLKGLGGGTVPELIATALLGFLILIPYFAYRNIAAKLGEEALLKLLFTRNPTQNQTHASHLPGGVGVLKDAASGRPR